MWINHLTNVWGVDPPLTIHNDGDVESNNSYTWYFTARRTGSMTFSANSTLSVRIFVCDTFQFNESTGEPQSYIGTDYSTGASVTFSVTLNNIYWIMIKGPSSGILSFTSTLSWIISSLQYSLLEESSITDLFGQMEVIKYEPIYSTTVIPITFKQSYRLQISSSQTVYSSYFSPVNMFCSTTKYDINPATGIPSGTNLITWDVFLPPYSLDGHVSVLANTTYYFYFAHNQYTQAIGKTRSEWKVKLRCFVDNTATNCTVRLDTDNIGNYGYTEYPDDTGYVSQDSRVGFGNEVWWKPENAFPLTQYSHTYKWGKLSGMYDLSTRISQYPHDTVYLRYADTSVYPPKYPVSAPVTLYEDDFSWTNTPVSQGPFNLTASEWNDFVLYCTCKAHITNGCKSCIKLGDLLTASDFNRIKNGLGYNIPDVAKGDIIYASYLNDMLALARSM